MLAPGLYPWLGGRGLPCGAAISTTLVMDPIAEYRCCLGPLLPLKLRLHHSKVRGHYNGCVYKITPRCQDIYFGLTQILELDIYDC